MYIEYYIASRKKLSTMMFEHFTAPSNVDIPLPICLATMETLSRQLSIL